MRPASGAKPLVRAVTVTKHYEQGLVTALSGVSFEIARGEIVALTGPSGCGKSTLLNLLGTLDQPTSGEILFDGRNILDCRPLHAFRARHVGFVFQFHHLIPTLSLAENVEAATAPLSLPGGMGRRKAEALLKALGLASRADFLPTRVSGGERQRAAIARALVNDPTLILADEPTGNLDAASGESVMGILTGHCRKGGATLIVATHNPEIARKADRVLRLRDGVLL